MADITTWDDDQLSAFRAGDRIELHPATDAWMRGDRYGTVKRIGNKSLHVEMDRSGRTLRLRPSAVCRIIT